MLANGFERSLFYIRRNSRNSRVIKRECSNWPTRYIKVSYDNDVLGLNIKLKHVHLNIHAFSPMLEIYTLSMKIFRPNTVFSLIHPDHLSRITPLCVSLENFFKIFLYFCGGGCDGVCSKTSW